MTGFDFNVLYSAVKANMTTLMPTCTVGRWNTPKETQFPYLDVALADSQGNGYTIDGDEMASLPTITLTAYCNGNIADSTCYEVLKVAKRIMLSYGFQCRQDSVKVTNSDTSVARWVSRFQRVFGSGDTLTQIHTI